MSLLLATPVGAFERAQKYLPETANPADPGCMTQINGINPVLNDMIIRGQLSGKKVSELIRLKHIADRFAQRPYLSAEEALSISAKYGEVPDILTWGDYFQTEIGSRFFDVSDEEFSKITDTVRFDLISSVLIFQGKPKFFLDQVRLQGLEAQAIASEDWTRAQEEAAHLFILMQYYQEMGLESCRICDADQEWFAGFTETANAAAG